MAMIETRAPPVPPLAAWIGFIAMCLGMALFTVSSYAALAFGCVSPLAMSQVCSAVNRLITVQ